MEAIYDPIFDFNSETIHISPSGDMASYSHQFDNVKGLNFYLSWAITHFESRINLANWLEKTQLLFAKCRTF